MINIYGAGISGLTIAHELINKELQVSIYEKNNIPGGMARSIRLSNNIPTEHSWRGYGPFYHNFIDIAKQIPISTIEHFQNKNTYTIEQIKKHNTKNDFWTYYKGNVYDLTKFVNEHPGGSVILNAAGKNLEEVWKEFGVGWHNNNTSTKNILEKYKIGKLIEPFNNNNVSDNLGKKRLKFEVLFNKNNNQKAKINSFDYPYLFYIFGKVITSNNRKDNYFSQKLDPLLKKNVSKSTYHFLADFLAGPGYGFDKNSMSLGHYGTFVEFNYLNKEKLWQVMNQPTSEAWIVPWVKYLKSKGVKFYFNAELKKLNYYKDKITSTIVQFKNKYIKVRGNYHIIATDPFSAQIIYQNSNLDKLAKPYLKFNTVNNQISFRLAFNRKIKFSKNNMGFVLVDSPYNITFYPQEDHWIKTDLGLNGKVKSLWSGTIILSYNKGSLTGKTATSLHPNELKKEIIHQFLQSEELIETIKENNNGYILNKNDIIYSEIFEDWEYQNGFLSSKNKKWVNNSYNEKYRPNNITPFINLFVSGGHTKTSVNIWSMESSVESGKMVSNIILKRHNLEPAFIHKHQSNKYIKPFKELDDLLYQFNLPHFFDVIIIIIILFVLFKTYHLFKKKL